jgi:hypothetical protein
MTAPNILQVSTIAGKTNVLAVTLTATDIVTNAAASNSIYKINSLMVSNVDGLNPADVTVDFFRGSVAYNIAKTVTVPADATLVVLSKENAIYLEEGDSIRVLASAVGDLEAICSYEVIT